MWQQSRFLPHMGMISFKYLGQRLQAGCSVS